ncbi:MAG: flagellar hook-length control protein FliK, partial [Candidatus Caldatribacteriota bacterium]
MLLGLQQLFSSSKSQGMTESLKGQELDLANLTKTQGLDDFAVELLNTLQGMNPEEAKAFMMTLPKDVQGQLENLVTLENPKLSNTVHFASQGFTQEPNVSLETMGVEQGFETNGIENKTSLKDFMSSLVGKKTPELKSQEVLTDKVTSRSPAIDFNPENIDQKLMDFEDFSLQKNLVKRTQITPTYPGLEAKKELNLKTTEVVNEISAGEGQVQNSAHFVLNTLVESQGNQSSTADSPLFKVETAAPIFDGNQIKSTDAKVIMDQISNYIIQAKASKEPTVNFKMNHSELGQLDITVAKAMQAGDAVAINIGASALEGKNFFTQNLKELSTHLAQAGITVTDIKVESSSAGTKSDFDFNQ